METDQHDPASSPVAAAERAALDAGRADLRASLERWNREGATVLREWMGTSLAIGLLLMMATLAVSPLLDDGILASPVFSDERTVAGAAWVLWRNVLVLAMHALICVAGYMALTSMPIVAEGYAGWRRTLHLRVARAAILFVTAVTVASFLTQVFVIGSGAAAVARAYGLETWQLLGVVSLHALPELVAVFLPLGAWLTLVRRGMHHELLAASAFATAIALPLLVIAAVLEEWVTPALLERLAGQ